MKQVSKGDTPPYFSLIGLVSFGPRHCGTKDQPGS